jgi:hypothetical protein
MKSKIGFVLAVAALTLFTISCKKEGPGPEPPNPVQNLNNISVSQDFDWKTSKDYQITLSSKSGGGLVSVGSAEGTVYQRAFLGRGKTYTMKFTVPASETGIRIIFLGQTVDMALSGHTLSYSFK